MLYLLTIKKRFKTKSNSNFIVNLAEMLKEETIHFFLFDESQISALFNYGAIEFILNYLIVSGTRRNRKRVRSNQAYISINSCTELSKV